MARKLLDGARGFAGAARHLAWYLSYCLDGSAVREAPAPVEELRAAEEAPAASR